MRSIVLIGVLGGVLAGCTAQTGQEASSQTTNPRASAAPRVALEAPRVAALPRALSSIANLPDRGNLVAYAQGAARREGATTWREVRVSEAHALRAITEGGMVVQAPNGQPIRLQYARRVEHQDGNWTWVGRPIGAKPGTEAMLTFGEKAVFGTIPNGAGAPLELTTSGGRTWMVENNDAAAVMPMDTDQIDAPQLPTRAMVAAATKVKLASSEAPANQLATVDLVLGYTSTWAARVGGASQALTRLNFIVDVANQAYFNSEIGGQLRLVRTVQVDYTDDSLNRTTLFELSGVTCTMSAGGATRLPDTGATCANAAVPAGLQPLAAAKVNYGADLVALVRVYNPPAQQSCGVAWLIGGGRVAIAPAAARFGVAVVSDSTGTAAGSPTCRSETLAHELGHTMGVQHDTVTAAGADDTNTDGNPLDPEEYGAYADAFGHKADNFFTIMAVPTAGQSGFRVFANPRLTSCNGQPCGVVGVSDNARVMGQTMPVIAGFASPRVPVSAVLRRGDFNADGKSDVVWHNASSSANSIWLSANVNTLQPMATVPNRAFVIVGAGDFNGDGRSDVLWRNISTGQNSIWRSGLVAQAQLIGTIADQAWQAVGIGDFNNDGRDDILWRNQATGVNSYWRSGDQAQSQSLARIADIAWTVAGVGDFDNDGRDDILWRNTRTGANSYWKGGNAATVQVLTTVSDLGWVIVGAGDFDGDGRDDVLWRNSRTGGNSIWKGGNSATIQPVATVASQAWMIVGIGDYDGDGKDDIQWRNSATGQNSIWKSGNVNTIQAMASVPQQFWIVSG